jgi:hypothetical protein
MQLTGLFVCIFIIYFDYKQILSCQILFHISPLKVDKFVKEMLLCLTNLKKYTTKPKLYAPSTIIFWNDEHISKGLLEAHLNPNWDGATRKPEFLDKSVNWISKIAPSSRYKFLLDLGCGPGLYADRFNISNYSSLSQPFYL